jgi:hypothetical protein
MTRTIYPAHRRPKSLPRKASREINPTAEKLSHTHAMRYAAPLTTLEPAKLDAFAASLRGGVLMLLAWLGDHLGFLSAGVRRHLEHNLRQAAHDAERIIFLHAAWHLRFFKPRQRPRAAPKRGFQSHYNGRACIRRRLQHIVGLQRGSLSDRARRIATLLANPAPAVARAIHRLRNGRHGALLKAIAPPATSVRHCAQRVVAAFADTS